MKKFLIPIILAILTGTVMAKIVFSQYDTPKLQTVFNENEEIMLLQIGVYSNMDSMKENTKDFDYYIYQQRDGLYYVFVGITQNESNLDKIKKFYQDLGYDVYVKKINVDNRSFLEILKQYDEIIAKTDDQKIIGTINGKILKKYEELVL